MKHIKKFLLFIVGVCVLLLAIFVFFRAQRSTDLEAGNLNNWRAATLDRRVAAVKILRAGDENLELIVACVDKMATLPESGEKAVRDAVALCYTGIQLKDNI